MTNFSSKNNDQSKSWLLPEFGLLVHAQHATQKKLKAKSNSFAKTAQLHHEAEQINGYKKGYESGLAQGTTEVNKKIAQLSSLLAELSAYKNSFDVKMKENISQFVISICERILMEKMSSSTSAIQNIIHRALEVIGNSSTGLKLFCNEALATQLTSQPVFAGSEQITIEKDNSLAGFNFRIESDKQFLYFNIQDSLRELIDETKEAILGSNP